jgi:sRNA-binding carbon storage regulator CsrA
VSVHREEVWLELQRANERAASPSDAAVAALGEEVRGLRRGERE